MKRRDFLKLAGLAVVAPGALFETTHLTVEKLREFSYHCDELDYLNLTAEQYQRLRMLMAAVLINLKPRMPMIVNHTA